MSKPSVVKYKRYDVLSLQMFNVDGRVPMGLLLKEIEKSLVKEKSMFKN